MAMRIARPAVPGTVHTNGEYFENAYYNFDLPGMKEALQQAKKARMDGILKVSSERIPGFTNMTITEQFDALVADQDGWGAGIYGNNREHIPQSVLLENRKNVQAYLQLSEVPTETVVMYLSPNGGQVGYFSVNDKIPEGWLTVSKYNELVDKERAERALKKAENFAAEQHQISIQESPRVAAAGASLPEGSGSVAIADASSSAVSSNVVADAISTPVEFSGDKVECIEVNGVQLNLDDSDVTALTEAMSGLTDSVGQVITATNTAMTGAIKNQWMPIVTPE